MSDAADRPVHGFGASALSEPVRALLRHLLATLAFRFQHALDGAPDDFAGFAAGQDARTPLALVRHVARLLRVAEALLLGDDPTTVPAEDRFGSWDEAITAVRDGLRSLDAQLLAPSCAPDPDALRRALHGPIVDAATHVGQLILLRRLAGAPVTPLSYLRAEVRAGELGPAPDDG